MSPSRSLWLFASLLLATSVQAQTVMRPERGSPERAAILDALREASARATYAPTRRDVVFTHVDLRVAGSWAFINATPTLPGGRASDHCHRAEPNESSDSNLVALMYRSEGTWYVLDTMTCMTDIGWGGLNWSGSFGAPASLYPQTLQDVRFPTTARVWSAGDGFLSLRSEPSVRRGQRLARMPDETRITVSQCGTMERVDGDWGRWCRVRFGRQDGWAFSHYLAF